MKKLLLSLLMVLITFANMIFAQETPKVKLDLIYKFDQNTKGNPLPEIIKALKSKAKSVPQEDVDWLLNKVRLDILREKQILYTDGGKEMIMPYFAYLPHSYNYKYFIYNTTDIQNRVYKNQKSKLIKTIDGRIVWEITNKNFAYASISNDGSVTIEQREPPHPEGIICNSFDFYNNRGILVKSINGLYCWPKQYALSNDNNIFVTITQDAKSNYCVGFDRSGNKLWYTEIPNGNYGVTLNFYNTTFYCKNRCPITAGDVNSIMINIFIPISVPLVYAMSRILWR